MPLSKGLARGLAILGFTAMSCLAQRETPNLALLDGQSSALWKISVEPDPTKKLAQYEQFVAEFPKDNATGWVYDQIYAILLDANDIPRAMTVAEKLLAIDPDDVELAYKSLKMAEEKKDPVLVRKWTQKAGDAARRTLAAPKATEVGARRTALAPQVLTYLDYLNYADILQVQNRTKKLEMMDKFLQTSPRSTYMPAMQRLYFATLREMDPGRALAYAEKLIETDQNNEDALILVAENYMQREKDPEKVLNYAERIVAILDQAPKTEGVTDVEWAKKKAGLSGRANWLIGSVSMQQNKYGQADRSLRAALPYVRSEPRLASMALFYLGWANYQIGNIPDAIRFTQDSSRMKGPYQEQAIKNLSVIKSEHPERQ